MEEIFTKRELAELLKVTEKTIDNLRKKGLPFFNVGDNVRFEKEKVLNWLHSNNTGKNSSNEGDKRGNCAAEGQGL